MSYHFIENKMPNHGSGPAGYTAVIYAARSTKHTSFISGMEGS
jgi:alkyl hydroperoxide reductase subunit AhpF